MKVVQINATCGIGSTGKICVGISEMLTEQEIENYILFSSKTNGYKFGISCATNIYIKYQAIKAKLLGNYGFNSIRATKRIINELERISPDIVHLHNVHGHDCNLEILFKYFKRKQIKLIWTFHDCWAFTGYCTHFTLSNCYKWQDYCNDCIQRKRFSWIFDKSKFLFENKKQLFDQLDLTIVTPSKWLGELARNSFLQQYPTEIINNGIDLEIFKPRESNFRKKYSLEDKKIVLGVSFGWNESKGIDVFIKLAKLLPTNYKIVLVGTDEKVDKMLPSNIISINKTTNQIKLAEIYSAADVFVNPTREDTFPTVNMESLACGTPVITFDTGGCSEIVNETCGYVIETEDIDFLREKIEIYAENKNIFFKNCIKRSKEFDKKNKFQSYIEIYKRLINE